MIIVNIFVLLRNENIFAKCNMMPSVDTWHGCCVSGSMCRVPDILFTTIEPPADLPIVGKGCFIQARICRPKKDSRGEANAKEISDVSQQALCTLTEIFDDLIRFVELTLG